MTVHGLGVMLLLAALVLLVAGLVWLVGVWGVLVGAFVVGVAGAGLVDWEQMDAESCVSARRPVDQ